MNGNVMVQIANKSPRDHGVVAGRKRVGLGRVGVMALLISEDCNMAGLSARSFI